MSGLPEARTVSISTAGYADGLGRRSVRFDREVGGMLECLHLRPELGAFDASLRERAGAFTALDDERFVRIRTIERDAQGVVVVSELVPGQRLSDVIDTRHRDQSAGFGLDAAFGFLLQVLPALSTLHAASIVHGAVAPGRIIVTPSSQIVLLDGIYAAALERLKLGRGALWSSLWLMAPPSAGGARFDRQGDVVQVVMCALVLALGRHIEGSGDPASLVPLVQEVTELAEIRAGREFGDRVQQFLGATLPLLGRRPMLGTDQAAAEIHELSLIIGAEASHAALADLVRFDASTRMPAAVETRVPVPPGRRGDRVEPPALRLVDPTRSVPVTPEALTVERAAPETVPLPEPQGTPEPIIAPEPSVSLEPVVTTPVVLTSREAVSAPTRVTPAPPPPPDPPIVTAPKEAVATAPAAGPPLLPAPPPVVAPAAPAAQPAPAASAASFTPAPPASFTPPPAPPPSPVSFTPAAAPPPPPVSFTPAAAPPPPPVSFTPAAAPPPPPPISFAPPPAPPPAARLTPAPVSVAPPPPIGFAPIPVRSQAPAPAPIVPVAPPPIATLRVRAEPPTGYTPVRGPSEGLPRALPFLDRAASAEPSSFPWKLAAAAMLVLAVAIVAGRSYLQPAPEEAVPVPAATTGYPAATAASAVAVDKSGSLAIDSQPTGAKVTLDGAEVGLTPLTLEGVASGRHTLVIATDTASVRRTVVIQPGKLVTLDVPVYSGWLSVFSPITLEVAAGGRSVGSTETGKIMLPPGRHVVTLSSREFGFTETRSVEIHSGEERPLNVEPMGRVNINAHPWAEVWVDGRKAGETPIANLPVLLGTRVFIFKHPLYGDRRITATITTTRGALSVDFTKP